MSVCVACNISDGVIIGVDSATTIGDPRNPIKIYDGVDKVFALGDYPVGLATYGLAAIGGRTIASWVAELVTLLPSCVPADYGMEDLVEAIRDFFWKQYELIVLQSATPVAEGNASPALPEMLPPILGFVIGGFGKNSFQSEVWNIQLPYHSTVNSALCQIGTGISGSAWFASMSPIHRYIKGFDQGALQSICAYINEIRNLLTPEEMGEIARRAQQAEFQFVFPGMPIAKGIEYVRFLIDLVIGHHKFAAGDPIVGGTANVGFVSFRKEPFQIVKEWRHPS
ncbi:hypothetical protein [Silvibacterium sp.]|uniref:hypothetical protein n=1 Tax=Silvibacterium sp. TaxID=1964179 RepID=UPI0039E29D3A